MGPWSWGRDEGGYWMLRTTAEGKEENTRKTSSCWLVAALVGSCTLHYPFSCLVFFYSFPAFLTLYLEHRRATVPHRYRQACSFPFGVVCVMRLVVIFTKKQGASTMVYDIISFFLELRKLVRISWCMYFCGQLYIKIGLMESYATNSGRQW